MRGRARDAEKALRARIEIAQQELSSRGELTVYRLMLCTNWKVYIARQALAALVEMGRAVVVQQGGRKGTVYAPAAAHAPAPRPSQSAYRGIPAGKIVIPQYRWNGTRLG